MRTQAILAGLRALVEQIDYLDRQTALDAAKNAHSQSAAGYGPAVLHANALNNSSIKAASVTDRVSISAPSSQAQSARRSVAASPQSRAAIIAGRLGVSSRNFFHVAHAVRPGISFAS